jgi:hypothetical protein
MSIAPVEGSSSVNPQSVSVSVGSGHPQPEPVVVRKPQPVSGTAPKQEPAVTNSVHSTFEAPRDVVEVHQDPTDKGQIIIQYLDKAGNVIVQVPSAQELSVERGIQEEFQREAKRQASADVAATASAGESSHGH